jgi:hypothetical protein
MSCDRIAEALHHLPEKQLTGRILLEAGNTPTTPDGRLRYLVGVAAPVEAEVGGTHQRHGAATTDGTLQFLTSRTLSEQQLLHFCYCHRMTLGHH